MRTNSKINELKQALLAGDVLTPLRAWDRWRMAHNTYHRSIWALKHNHGLPIRSMKLRDEGSDVTHSYHWLER